MISHEFEEKEPRQIEILIDLKKRFHHWAMNLGHCQEDISSRMYSKVSLGPELPTDCRRLKASTIPDDTAGCFVCFCALLIFTTAGKLYAATIHCKHTEIKIKSTKCKSKRLSN